MKKSVVLTLGFALAFTVAACGGKSGKINPKMHDGNCVIGHEEKAAADTYIGKFFAVSNKAKMVNFGVKAAKFTIKFNDKTQWVWNSEVKSKGDLKKNKGYCIAVTVKNKVITKIQALEPYKVPADQLVDTDTMKKMIAEGGWTIVDSRPTGKWAEAHIPGAISIPLGALKKGSGWKKLPADKNAKLVFYCGGFHCKLAPFSGKLAVEKGYKAVKVYHAGMPGWKKGKSCGVKVAGNLLKLQKKKASMIIIDTDGGKENIPGAVKATPSTINAMKGDFPKSKKDKKSAPVVVYGKDARAVAAKIVSWGYKGTTILKGGLKAYKEKGGKVVPGKYAAKVNYVARKMPGETTAKEFLALVKNGKPADMVIIDVRGADEAGSENPGVMLLGAKNIPLDTLEGKAGSLDKSKKYYTFCATGMRAGLARDVLAKAGLKAFYVKTSVETKAGEVILNGNKISKAQAAKIAGK
jgi:rhodanese-related sulfurtransferase